MIIRKFAAFLVFICFLFASTAGFSQETDNEKDIVITDSDYKDRRQNLLIDIPLTIAEITVINLIGNGFWRIWGPDNEAAYFTLESMRSNLDPDTWDMEVGLGADSFITNQFFHPYAGALYFASARSNNINFYWSMLSSTFGSLQWEALGEVDSPASSDLINTAVGGFALGEILHRLYMELNRSGRKIGATFVSPVGRVTDAIRGYGPPDGPGKIYGSSLAAGFSWVNASFFNNCDEIVDPWSQPAGFINFDLVYGDPYIAHSKIPFDQFDLFTSIFVSYPLSYNFTIITDGYLASWCLSEGEATQASNGISLSFDAFITDEGTLMTLNSGRESLSFNANSLNYSIKWNRFFNNLGFSMKTHLGLTPWAVANYVGGLDIIGGSDKLDYNMYLFGWNFKLFFELYQLKENARRKNGQALLFSLCFYDTWYISKTTPYVDNRTNFLYSNINYSFPMSDIMSFYIGDSFYLMHCEIKEDAGPRFSNLTRWLNNAQVGARIKFR